MFGFNTYHIGVGRFRILGGGGGGGGARGGKGGPNSQQAHDGVMTLTTSFRRHVPTRVLVNQCQIITFCHLKI